MFFCKYCKTFKSNFSYRTALMAAFGEGAVDGLPF